MSILQTPRLDLIPASAEVLEWLVAKDYGRAGQKLGVFISEGWPHDPEAVDGLAWHLRALQNDPSAYVWRVRLLVFRAERRVIGSINLKGLPEADGTIEIGWGVAAEYRRQGLATEGTQAVIEWGMAQPGVRRVIATIPPDNRASQRVAERVGMRPTQETRRGLSVWEVRWTTAAGSGGSAGGAPFKGSDKPPSGARP